MASAKVFLLLALSSAKKVKRLTSRMSFALSTASKLMASSLDKLVGSLSLESRRLGHRETKLKETEKVLKDQIHLVSRKDVYPYDYTDGITKFDETELPPKEGFYSTSSDSDVFLLADVFRKVSLENYELILPGLSPLLDWVDTLYSR